MKIKVKKMREGAMLPTYATDGSGAFDLYACGDHHFMAGTSAAKIPLGIAVEIPQGHIMVICARSSIGAKTPLRMSNSIGIIDSDYRGEILAIYDNNGLHEFTIHEGDRIAQGFIIPIPYVVFQEVEELGKTIRGTGGFGSTGK